MKLPIHFQSEPDKIYQEAVTYRRLSPSDRLLVLLDLIASGAVLLEQSPHREASRRLQDAYEAEWQKAQKELFARHAG
jgi:hypothetical protein